MFTFECLNHRAKLILASWEASGFDLRDFYVREEDGYTNIHCKHDYLHYKSEEVNILTKALNGFKTTSAEPYYFTNQNGYSSWRYYLPDGTQKSGQDETSQPLNWPQQIERYRVALLLQATG